MNPTFASPPDRPGLPIAQGPDAGKVEADKAVTDGSPLRPLGSDPGVRASTPPAILEAQRMFLRDLPELLRERPGQWVAYYDQQRIGFAKTKDDLWEECHRRGFQEFVIRLIRPHPETDWISAL